ncbi:MAG: ketopantoate reductase family protein, partial [Nocardioidaceae bacterium]
MRWVVYGAGAVGGVLGARLHVSGAHVVLLARGAHEDTVVLLTVKSHQTAAALEDLTAHAPAGTPVVCVQNGVANEPAALRFFEHVYG